MTDKQVLIIEDDKAILAVTKFSLEMENNWTVITALQGKDGIEKAKNLHPDVILLDVIMPGMSGINIIQKLQQDSETKKIPVILFTAKFLENDSLQRQYSNIKGVIMKPFDCLKLAAEITNILNNCQ